MTIEPPTPTMEEGPKVKAGDGTFKLLLLSDEESEEGDQKEGGCKEGGDEEGGRGVSQEEGNGGGGS